MINKAQQDFHYENLQPILEEAKAGKRTVLFVDAAHFVRGAGLVWCFIRVLLPSVGVSVTTYWEPLIPLTMK
jgi:hypothetical protein